MTYAPSGIAETDATLGERYSELLSKCKNGQKHNHMMLLPDAERNVLGFVGRHRLARFNRIW